MTLIERVRRSLAPDYQIDREIGRGGMGVVFRAVDRRLDHAVAIKVLRPEQATARAVERFLREGRALAAVDHPSVLRVHRAGEAGGLHYYVMELVEGDTLAARLRRGPLDASELERLRSDLLAALAAIHEQGLVHRDVKPSNIFLVDGRAVLGDFGIAASSGTGRDRLTGTGELVGTPAYLAPEQRHGKASPATDVYAAALVLYEAATGTPWADAGPDRRATVPRRLRPNLRRALAPDPGARPADARAWRAELERSGRTRRIGAAATALVLASAVVTLVLSRGGSAVEAPAGTADLAILPFQAIGSGGDSRLARDLWHLTTLNLQGLEGLKVLPPAQASRLALEPRPGLLSPDRPPLRALALARGTVVGSGSDLVLRLAIVDSTGRPLGEERVRGSAEDLYGTADSAALALVRTLVPHLASSYRRLDAVHTDDFRALRAFLQGEDAFMGNAWGRAEEHYREALAEDSTFTLARWRLWYVHGWRLTGEANVDLRRLHDRHAHELGTVDAALLSARAIRPGPERLDALERVAQRLGHSSHAWLLLGDEHYHRGPLAGGSLEEAARYLAEAAARDPHLAPAHEHSVMVLTRLGRRDDAVRALEALLRTAAPPAPGEELYIPALLEQAVRARFVPGEERGDPSLLDPSLPASRPALMFVARMGLAYDVPEAQRALGEELARPENPPSMRAQGHMAQATALMVLGRPAAALVHFDSAARIRIRTAALDSSGFAALEAAEWRVLAPALGIAGVPPEAALAGRESLRGMAREPSAAAARAVWALAIDARFRGDSAAAGRWRDALEASHDPELWRLRPLEDAFAALAEERYEPVLASTRPLLPHQYAPDQGYPFVRTALHLVRARAAEAMGDPRTARRERAWADNQDAAHQLIGPLQPVEVDWVASPYSDRDRARLALSLGDTVQGCRLLDRVRRLWADAEPALDSLGARDARLRQEACP